MRHPRLFRCATIVLMTIGGAVFAARAEAKVVSAMEACCSDTPPYTETGTDNCPYGYNSPPWPLSETARLFALRQVSVWLIANPSAWVSGDEIRQPTSQISINNLGSCPIGSQRNHIFRWRVTVVGIALNLQYLGVASSSGCSSPI
jgi:hypothetical protein